MALVHSPSIVTGNLMLYLDASNLKSYPGAGTTWIDLTGNNRNSELINGPSFSSAGHGSFLFDGVNDYARLPGNLTSTILAWTPVGSVGSSNISIEIWFKTTDSTGELYSKPWNGVGGYNIRINTSQINIGPIHNNYSHFSTMSFTNQNDGNYHQIVFWASASNFGYSIDGGRLAASQAHGFSVDNPAGGSNSNLDGLMMSLYPYGSGWAGDTGLSTNGYVSIFRIYHKVLTSTEILQNFNAMRGRYGI